MEGKYVRENEIKTDTTKALVSQNVLELHNLGQNLSSTEVSDVRVFYCLHDKSWRL